MAVSFPIPEAALARHIAVLGETGSGKTHDTKTIVEHLVGQGYRVCVLDTIKSDWWGMISSATGKSAGLPFRIIGGPRGHVPLHAGAGRPIGELVAKGALPLSIIDMADFEAGDPQRFFEDFARALWRNIKGVLYLVIEEAHEIAPKERAGFGKENMSVYWAKKLATGSRTKGIRLIIASQRTQAVHNALLGSCGTMIAHSLSLPADQKPVRDWLDANILDKGLNSTIKDELAFLPTGTAWVCCAKERFFEKVKFPKIKTFDNTATPDKDATDFEVATAAVDPEELRSIIGDAVKEAEANDPAALKKEIARLNKDLAAAKRVPAAAAPAPTIQKVVQGPTQEQIDALLAQAEEAARALGRHEGRVEFAKEILVKVKELEALGIKDLALAINRLAGALEKIAESSPPKVKPLSRKIAARTTTAPRQASYTPAAPIRMNGPVHDGVSGPQQKILDALAWLESVGIRSASRVQVAMLADQSSKSSGYEKNVSTLKTAGFVDYPEKGALVLSESGRAIANSPAALLDTAALHSAIRSKVSGPQWRILEALIECYPEALSREQLGERSNQSALSSGFEKNISTMASFGFVRYPAKGHVAATELLFIEGR